MKPVSIHKSSILLPEIYSIQDFSNRIVSGQWDSIPDQIALPKSNLIPSRMKRRMSRLTQMAVESTYQAREGLQSFADIPLIVGSSNGEINTIGKIMLEIFDDPALLSPTQFHNSVHNTAPGYWCILSKLHHSAETVSSGELTFEFTIIDALTKLNLLYDCIQITICDAKIDIPKWADPSHSSIDFCGSFILRQEPSTSGLATILEAHDLELEEDGNEKISELIDKYRPDRITGDTIDHLPIAPFDFIGQHQHPCIGMFSVLKFIHDPTQAGRIMTVRKGTNNDVFVLILEKNCDENAR